MIIRQATVQDIDTLMQVFEEAKKIMRSSGNLQQWNDGYPGKEVVIRDIEHGHCLVACDEDDSIIGTMALIPGPDPTYSYIEGEWPDEAPYYVIHRIAVMTPGRDLARVMLDKAFRMIHEKGVKVIRIDTHKDNCIMKHVLAKYGFTMCGIIYLDDGAPREAYHKTTSTT